MWTFAGKRISKPELNIIQCFAQSVMEVFNHQNIGLWQPNLFSRFHLCLNPTVLWAEEPYPIPLDHCLFQYTLHFLNGIWQAVPLCSAWGTWNRRTFQGTPQASTSDSLERRHLPFPSKAKCIPYLHFPPWCFCSEAILIFSNY